MERVEIASSSTAEFHSPAGGIMKATLPIRYDVTAVYGGEPGVPRYDFAAYLFGRQINLGPDVPQSRNGHFATEAAARKAGLRAIRAWATDATVRALGTWEAAR